MSTLGRSRSCTVTLSDASASRTHAEIEASNGSVKLRDLGSSNGTYVDGARVAGEIGLRNGSLITIGETVMTLRAQPLLAPEPVALAPVQDVAATVRIETIKRPTPQPEAEPAGGPGPAGMPGLSPPPPPPPLEPPPLAAPSLRTDPPPAAAAPGLGAGEPYRAPPLAAPALGGPPPAPTERPVSRTDVFSPVGGASPFASQAAPPEKTMLEIPSSPRSSPPPPLRGTPAAGSAPASPRPALDDMRPREPGAPPVHGDMLGSIDALDHTALGARAVRAPAPPPTRPVGAPVGRPAGFWIRFGALVVDGVAIGLPLAALNFLLTFVIPVEVASLLGGVIGMVVGIGLPVVGWAIWGRTPGKALLRIAVVAEGSNRPGIGFGKALLRLVGYAISAVVAGIGFLMAGFGDKRALHDRIAGTRVIRL